MTTAIRDFANAAVEDEADAYEHNIENFVGIARVPVGLAGPLRIVGTAARGEYPIPLATTEAALVASYNRGMRVIALSGGCSAAVLDERMERSPAFVLRALVHAVRFARWIREHRTELAAAAETTSRYARCIAVEPVVEGNHVYL